MIGGIVANLCSRGIIEPLFLSREQRLRWRRLLDSLLGDIWDDAHAAISFRVHHVGEDYQKRIAELEAELQR